MTEKFERADEYRPDITRDCELVLVILMRAFTSSKEHLRLIGGLVPRYLTPESPPHVPAHVGTTDVDVVLDLAVLVRNTDYTSLKKQLEKAGFIRQNNDYGKPTSWRWGYLVNGHTVVVELLLNTDDPDQAKLARNIEGEKVSACQILHAGIASSWYGEREVTVDLPDDRGLYQETIRYADAVSFIVLKALALAQRNEPKDAADLIHVMRYWGITDDLAAVFAERIQSGQHTEALESALNALARSFCDSQGIDGREKEAPQMYVRFHGIGADDRERRARELNDIVGLVTYFLQLVQEKTGRTYLPA